MPDHGHTSGQGPQGLVHCAQGMCNRGHKSGLLLFVADSPAGQWVGGQKRSGVNWWEHPVQILFLSVQAECCLAGSHGSHLLGNCGSCTLCATMCFWFCLPGYWWRYVLRFTAGFTSRRSGTPGSPRTLVHTPLRRLSAISNGLGHRDDDNTQVRTLRTLSSKSLPPSWPFPFLVTKPTFGGPPVIPP